MMRGPYFSIVISAYNRVGIVERCVESCFCQTFSDFEVIVVDDGSTDGTATSLRGRWNSRLRVISHESNRGINPARYTGVSQARGEWVVVVDSDWELLPHALQRLYDISRALPRHVRVIRSRLLWDDGHVSPSFVPEGPVGYEERIRWVDEEGGDDAGRCMHRSVFDSTPYLSNRRGAMETLYELDLAQNETSIYVDDVLGLEHTDAANSYLRDVDRSKVVPRLLGDAPDMLWMAETTLHRHGDALKRLGPRQYRALVRVAMQQAFLMAERRRGLQYGFKYLRMRPGDVVLWATLVLGMLGPKPLAVGTLAYRIRTA